MSPVYTLGRPLLASPWPTRPLPQGEEQARRPFEIFTPLGCGLRHEGLFSPSPGEGGREGTGEGAGG